MKIRQFIHILKKLLLPCIGLLIFISCEEEEKPAPLAEEAEETEKEFSVYISENELFFHHQSAMEKLYIINTGDLPFNVSIQSDREFLVPEPAAASLQPGDSVLVKVNASRSGLADSSYFARLFIQADEYSFGRQIPARLVQYARPGEVWSLPQDIIDAEYNPTGDNIIAVAKDGKLHKIDPSTKTTESLELGLTPLYISVRPDLQEAVVGHQAAITYVDLASMEIKAQYGLPVKVFDAVIAMNGYAYVFPSEGSWTQIYSIHLASGATTSSGGYSINDKTYARLHPSGDFIYGADTNISPSDFEKYRITDGRAEVLYDSPYHGDYPFSGGIWISEDGKFLFAKSRHVFTSSIDQQNDLKHITELQGAGEVVALDYTAEKERTYAIFSGHSWFNNQSSLPVEVWMYDKNFSLTARRKLPKILMNSLTTEESLRDFQGRFGFFNSAGTAFFVLGGLAQIPGTLPEKEQWGIYTIEVE